MEDRIDQLSMVESCSIQRSWGWRLTRCRINPRLVKGSHRSRATPTLLHDVRNIFCVVVACWSYKIVLLGFHNLKMSWMPRTTKLPTAGFKPRTEVYLLILLCTAHWPQLYQLRHGYMLFHSCSSTSYEQVGPVTYKLTRFKVSVPSLNYLFKVAFPP